MNISSVSSTQSDEKTRAFTEHLYVWWSDVRCFLHGLRLAWVSVASIVIGVLLLVGLQPNLEQSLHHRCSTSGIGTNLLSKHLVNCDRFLG